MLRVQLKQIGERREAFACVHVLGLERELVAQRGQDIDRQVSVVL